MLAESVPTVFHCKYLAADIVPMKPVVENFIHSFGGISYDSGEMLIARFTSAQAADECAAELAYLYRSLLVEIDGEWLAVYLS